MAAAKRQIDEFTVADYWKKYSEEIFKGIEVSDIQFRETKRTFYSAFGSSIRALTNIMTDDVDEEEGAVKLNDLLTEARAWIHNPTFENNPAPTGPLDLVTVMGKVQMAIAPYDVGAHVILCSRQSGEFKFLLPSWSIAQFVPLADGRQGVRFKAAKEQHQEVEDTVRMIVTVRDICKDASEGMQNILQQLKQVMEIHEGTATRTDRRGPGPDDMKH